MNLHELKKFIKQNGGSVTVAELQLAFSLDYPEARRIIGVLEKNEYIAYMCGLEYVSCEKSDERDEDENDDLLHHSDEDEGFSGEEEDDAEEDGEDGEDEEEDKDDEDGEDDGGEDNGGDTKRLHTSFSEFLKRYRRQSAEPETKRHDDSPRIGEFYANRSRRDGEFNRAPARRENYNYTGNPVQNEYLNAFHDCFDFRRAGDDLYEIFVSGENGGNTFAGVPLYIDFNMGAPLITDRGQTLRTLIGKMGYPRAEEKYIEYSKSENDFMFYNYKISRRSSVRTVLRDYIEICFLIRRMLDEV